MDRIAKEAKKYAQKSGNLEEGVRWRVRQKDQGWGLYGRQGQEGRERVLEVTTVYARGCLQGRSLSLGLRPSTLPYGWVANPAGLPRMTPRE